MYLRFTPLIVQSRFTPLIVQSRFTLSIISTHFTHIPFLTVSEGLLRAMRLPGGDVELRQAIAPLSTARRTVRAALHPLPPIKPEPRVNLLLASAPDDASVNLRDHLLELATWERDGEFQGAPVWVLRDDHGGFCHAGTRLATLADWHLYAEGIDDEWAAATGAPAKTIVFLSRHSAASGRPTLTVHPVGNWSAAEYGGRPGELTPAAPRVMAGLLRALAVAPPDGFAVSYEVTHHGPLLTTPALFVEIGSGPEQWPRRTPAEAIARALLAFAPADGPVLVGLGGGHYAPRFTDVALHRAAAFGHMVPKYALEALTPVLLRTALTASGADGLYLHRKGMRGADRRRWRVWAAAEGVRVWRQGELAPREG